MLKYIHSISIVAIYQNNHISYNEWLVLVSFTLVVGTVLLNIIGFYITESFSIEL